MRSIVCNPQLVAGCNHHKVMYVINPKTKTYNPCSLMTYSSLCELITCAYRRLHTNPSDWIKKDKSFDLSFFGCFELNGTNEMCLKTEDFYHLLHSTFLSSDGKIRVRFFIIQISKL